MDRINSPYKSSYIDKLSEQLKCIVHKGDNFYVSAPITSGKRFISWYKSTGKNLKGKGDNIYRHEHFQSVITKNIEEANNKICALKNSIDGIIIDPSKLEFQEWEQDEYRYYWGKIIEQYVNTVIFLDSWEYSNGCTFEFLKASNCGLKILNEDLKTLTVVDGLELLNKSIHALKKNGLPTAYIEKIINELQNIISINLPVNSSQQSIEVSWTLEKKEIDTLHYKDEILNDIAFFGNVAQFVSFNNDNFLSRRFNRISGFEPNHNFESAKNAIEHLLENSVDHKVNIRSFRPDNPKGCPFIYGLSSVDDVLNNIIKLSSEGLYTIVNETIDVSDSGVSGVLLNDLIEFSPDDTPKCVEKAGTCRLPRILGIKLLSKIYGFFPLLNYPPEYRVEFSIHPIRRGFLKEHTIIWEIEYFGDVKNSFEIDWPNNFSRFIGDKAFGLLLADTILLPVPKTHVIGKRLPVFSFGQNTQTNEYWIRTCPEVPEPGYYTTKFGWSDPFELMSEKQDEVNWSSSKSPVKSILSQESVEPIWSGALMSSANSSKPVIEGVKGRGDKFMLGKRIEVLPNDVMQAVHHLYNAAFSQIGPVHIEWVFDGQKAWCVQIHKLKENSISSDIIVEGHKNTKYVNYYTKNGLDGLRSLIKSMSEDNDGGGVNLIGDIGITSHFGDLLRKAKIPSKIVRSES